MVPPDTERDASVLLAFRAGNVRSFRDELEFSMLATGLTESYEPHYVRWREGGSPIGVLTASGIFGANASGKTNLLKVMDDMRTYVLRSFRDTSPTGGIRLHPFLLDPASEKAPSRFEVDIVLRGIRHEYGFVLDAERVVEEWAYRYPKGRSAMLFHRHGMDVELGPAERTKGRLISELLRPNALFLSTAASANHPILLILYEWFERNFLLADEPGRFFRQLHTVRMLDDPAGHAQVLALLRAADLGISGAKRRRLEFEPVMKERFQRAVRILAGRDGEPGGEEATEFEPLELRLTHHGSDREVELDPNDESLGTLVWFGLVGPVIQALAGGAVLLADELDASLHPALVAQLVRLFQNPATNPRRAQLIFNSHDVTLLGDSVSDRILRRDQVWFTEKNSDGSTRLYALADLDPRKEEAIGRRYLAGRYGAAPILSDQQFAAIADAISAGDAG